MLVKRLDRIAYRLESLAEPSRSLHGHPDLAGIQTDIADIRLTITTEIRHHE
jgi:hypothetical protein